MDHKEWQLTATLRDAGIPVRHDFNSNIDAFMELILAVLNIPPKKGLDDPFGQGQSGPLHVILGCFTVFLELQLGTFELEDADKRLNREESFAPMKSLC